MELNWSTFVLEIINFLVLVWILKRFLYKPVLDVIARRKAGIEKTLADARALEANAEKLRSQYEGRLADWGRERQQAREAMLREFETERASKATELQNSLDQERQKARVATARRVADEKHKIEQTALDQAAGFASRLLEKASGPDTEARLVGLLVDELSQLQGKNAEALRNNFGTAPEEILICSAFPLDDDQRRRIGQALAGISGADLPVRYEQNSELIAGLRITIGAWVLGANVRDELKGFSELAGHG